MELVVAKQIEFGQGANVQTSVELLPGKVTDSLVTYALDYVPEHTGMFDVALRVFPKNAKLPHRMDFALVKWA